MRADETGSTVAKNWERLQERIAAAMRRAGRADSVTVVAVSKTVEPGRIAEAYRCGLRHFGESRVQEFEEKRGQLTLPVAVFHLVGTLQRNKARRAVELFDRVDTVDNLPLAEKLARAAAERGRELPVLLEVRLGDEATKHGLPPEQVAELARQVARLEPLRLRGLLGMPPYFEDASRTRPFFRQLRELAEELACLPGVSMSELSMGMSHDFEVAVEEGATEVRLGTALFEKRQGAAQ